MELADYWAKTSPRQSVITHGLVSGHVAQTLFDQYLSKGSRELMQRILELDLLTLRSLVGYLVSLHDIGKIEYTFQAKDPFTKELLDRDKNLASVWLLPNVRHEKTGRSSLIELWKLAREDEDAVDLLSAVIGAHHPGRTGKDGFKKDTFWFGKQREFESRMHQEFLGDLENVLPVIPDEYVGTVGAVLLALLILSDWISSGPAFADAENWVDAPNRRERIINIAEDFLIRSGLHPNSVSWPNSFCGLWPVIPSNGKRPLQSETEALFSNSTDSYSLVLLEAPMGEGKTEAGVYAAVQMARQWKKDGIYIALPTAATSNQMVGRIRDLLEQHGLADKVRLLHAMAWLESSETFKPEDGEETDGIANWLAPIRRGLLGQYAVGTVDQAMLAATTVKYAALRLLGLSNKVLIIDEIHSYDAYMSEILRRLLEWCKALDIPVVMLSATLPPAKKQELFTPYTSQPLSNEYPLITAIRSDGAVNERIVCHTTHSLSAKLNLLPCLNDAEQIAEAAITAVEDGGCLCVLMNTVKEAQSVYSALKQRWDGDLLLFHAQFPVQRRAEIEDACIHRYGKDKRFRPKRSILVATQVVEQSLDVDFDTMFSAVAPIDLILQRLGRVHRHSESPRPAKLAAASLTVLIPEEGKNFGASAYVYPECLLKSSIRVLEERSEIRIPEDLAQMVQTGYDPESVPPEEMLQWREMLIRDQVNAGASQQFLANPPSCQYNPLVDDVVFEDEGGRAAAATRLGEPAVRLALLESQQFDLLRACIKEKNGETVAEVWDKKTAEMVMRQSVSVGVSRFQKELSGLLYIKGDKMISGTRIVLMDNSSCSLGGGRRLCNDPELGLIVKEGEA